MKCPRDHMLSSKTKLYAHNIFEGKNNCTNILKSGESAPVLSPLPIASISLANGTNLLV